jgi:uncharacterized membrane protein YphA (DoxX/SURF4 family)
MQLLATIARGLSIISFGWYGASLLWSQAMAADFARYGLSRYRVMVGVLQLAGSAGLLVGFWFRPLALFAAGGLALMMLVAIGARIQARDSVIAMLPAAAYCCLNLYIAAAAW